MILPIVSIACQMVSVANTIMIGVKIILVEMEMVIAIVVNAQMALSVEAAIS